MRKIKDYNKALTSAIKEEEYKISKRILPMEEFLKVIMELTHDYYIHSSSSALLTN
jgi:hypothetical protein